MPRGRKPKVLERVRPVHAEGATVATLDYKAEKWTVSKLMDFMNKNKIKDVEIQRGVCWNLKQRSLFIHSVIMNYYIPPLLMVKTGNKGFDLLDGKQRSSTLYDFINDKFKLKDIPAILYDDEVSEDFTGLKFSQLPEDIQNLISDYNLNIVIFSEGTSEKQTEDVFFRYNNGTALNTTDKNFSIAVSKDKISSLISHPFFERAMTENAREKLISRQVIINSYIILLTDNYSLDSGNVVKFLREYEISEENRNELYDLFTRLSDISERIEENTDPGTLERKAAKRIFGRVNIPVLVKFLQSHNDDDRNADFLTYFFSGEKKASVNETYNEASQSGSNHLDNIQRRIMALNEEYDKFINNAQ